MVRDMIFRIRVSLLEAPVRLERPFIAPTELPLNPCQLILKRI